MCSMANGIAKNKLRFVYTLKRKNHLKEINMAVFTNLPSSMDKPEDYKNKRVNLGRTDQVVQPAEGQVRCPQCDVGFDYDGDLIMHFTRSHLNIQSLDYAASMEPQPSEIPKSTTSGIVQPQEDDNISMQQASPKIENHDDRMMAEVTPVREEVMTFYHSSDSPAPTAAAPEKDSQPSQQEKAVASMNSIENIDICNPHDNSLPVPPSGNILPVSPESNSPVNELPVALSPHPQQQLQQPNHSDLIPQYVATLNNINQQVKILTLGKDLLDSTKSEMVRSLMEQYAFILQQLRAMHQVQVQRNSDQTLDDDIASHQLPLVSPVTSPPEQIMEQVEENYSQMNGHSCWGVSEELHLPSEVTDGVGSGSQVSMNPGEYQGNKCTGFSSCCSNANSSASDPSIYFDEAIPMLTATQTVRKPGPGYAYIDNFHNGQCQMGHASGQEESFYGMPLIKMSSLNQAKWRALSKVGVLSVVPVQIGIAMLRSQPNVPMQQFPNVSQRQMPSCQYPAFTALEPERYCGPIGVQQGYQWEPAEQPDPQWSRSVQNSPLNLTMPRHNTM